MSDDDKQIDPETGIPWITVSREKAHGHPRGRIGGPLLVVLAYLVLGGGFKLWIHLTTGAGIGALALGGALPVLAGVLMARRQGWGYWLAILSGAYVFLHGIQYVGGHPIWLADMIGAAAMLFYLFDGDRPNLVFRHRYRQYSAVEGRRDDV